MAASCKYSIDPEQEAFKALKNTICTICKKHDITSKDDVQLQKIIDKYKDRYPTLTAELIENEIKKFSRSSSRSRSFSRSRSRKSSLPQTLEADDSYSVAESSLAASGWGGTAANTGASTPQTLDTTVVSAAGGSRPSTPPLNNLETDEKGSSSDALVEVGASAAKGPPPEQKGALNRNRSSFMMVVLPSEEEERKAEEERMAFTNNNEPSITEEEVSPSGCCYNFKTECKENNGYNLLTYTLFLTFFVILMFLISVISTYVNYNHGPYRDWALAGGVTSTSAQFRVRGPSSDDGKRREFVVSTNPNLALERDQIRNIPVSFADFADEEHYMKRLSLDTLTPLTPYYYGITRPQRTPNSAVVAGEVGTFTTPAPEGTRMDFTIATGSCALTGSKSDMFTKVLDLDPLMFIHMGDIHYEDLNTLDIDKRLEAYDKVMGSPSQRLLYMRTIFSYIWDDHDWLGNNQDSDYEEAAAVAKQSYTLGIPHYDLGSRTNEADAAKYQAYTIGTVRFIITDLRSESIKSSEYYSGKVYSKEQRDWLFDEFSRAANYDFVVWVTTRPWTDPVKVGSDSWGGFVSDRDELSAHIASTIGAGPRNLLVLSGDNHMVAFDDGSSTDYSGQDDNPGGFPLLHSGPLTNYGGGMVDFFKRDTHYFTDGCMATNSELNYQFSTVDFYFPEREDRYGCMRIKSYSKDSSNVIFEKELCGRVMKYGTPEQDTCTLEKLTVPTQFFFIAAAGFILLNGILASFFLGINRFPLALSYVGLEILYYLLTIGAAIAGALCFGMLGVNMFAVSVFVLLQAAAGSLFVGKAIFGHCTQPETDGKSTKIHSPYADEEAGMKAIDKGDDVDMNAMEEDGAATYDDTLDDATAPPVVGGGVIAKSDEKKIHADSIALEMEEEFAALAIELEEEIAASAIIKMSTSESVSEEKTGDSAASELRKTTRAKSASNESTDIPAFEKGEAVVKSESKGSSHNSVSVPLETREASIVEKYPTRNAAGDDSSVAAVLSGGVANASLEEKLASSLEEKVASVLMGDAPFPDVNYVTDSMAAVFSSAKNVTFVEGMAAAFARSQRSFRRGVEDSASALLDSISPPAKGAPKEEETEKTEEGIEAISTGYDVRVSPSLISM
eukprot:CAMPEP_0172319200 /NCGR_PEP_ID=MMETSP1058-20130122/37084_1 /TAXON_ID=83371 /ORGANISM="Detonula confervacea, Strain CCMP 353" /LENGTH=1125 /DNA_ID=CAMNT_0013034199 /DNA_START=97 /DNA_END=3474 /DNA_ORIENTATION=+